MLMAAVTIMAGVPAAQALTGYIIEMDNFQDTYYGEAWNYTSAGYPVLVNAAADVYYNLTGLQAGQLNGFTFTGSDMAGGGSYLAAQHSGIYKLSAHVSFSATATGGQYGIGIFRNFAPAPNRDCYARVGGTTAVTSVPIACIISMNAGDKINLQYDDETNPPKNITIYTANMNLVRIG